MAARADDVLAFGPAGNGCRAARLLTSDLEPASFPFDIIVTWEILRRPGRTSPLVMPASAPGSVLRVIRRQWQVVHDDRRLVIIW